MRLLLAPRSSTLVGSTRVDPGGGAVPLDDNGRDVDVDRAAVTEPIKIATTARTAGSSTRADRYCAAVLRSTSSRAASAVLITSSSSRRRCVGPMPQYCVSSDQMVTVDLRHHRVSANDGNRDDFPPHDPEPVGPTSQPQVNGGAGKSR